MAEEDTSDRTKTTTENETTNDSVDRCKCKDCRHPSDSEHESDTDSDPYSDSGGRPEWPPETPPPGDSYYPKGPRDAIAILEILSNWLPSELGLRILNDAGYWIRSRITSRRYKAIWERHMTDPPMPYLISEPITGTNIPVREIKITIWSHDEASNSSESDFYAGEPWSWFELGIQRPPGREEIMTNIGRLVTNKPASNSPMRRQVMFRREEDPWVRELRAGDQITIIPHVRFPEWTNYTRGAWIEIYTDPFSYECEVDE